MGLGFGEVGCIVRKVIFEGRESELCVNGRLFSVVCVIEEEVLVLE